MQQPMQFFQPIKFAHLNPALLVWVIRIQQMIAVEFFVAAGDGGYASGGVSFHNTYAQPATFSNRTRRGVRRYSAHLYTISPTQWGA